MAAINVCFRGKRTLAGSKSWSPRGGTNRRDPRRRISDAVVISHEVARVAISRRSRPFRQHGFVPSLPIALQTIEDFAMPIFQISPLTRVLDHIEEKFVPGDPQVFPWGNSPTILVGRSVRRTIAFCSATQKPKGAVASFVAVQESAVGTKRTSQDVGPFVRFRGKSGHTCSCGFDRIGRE
jgi:hypothetical protein